MVRSVQYAIDLLQENDMSDIGYRLATDEENERARREIVSQTRLARNAAERLGAKPNPRILDAKLR